MTATDPIQRAEELHVRLGSKHPASIPLWTFLAAARNDLPYANRTLAQLQRAGRELEQLATSEPELAELLPFIRSILDREIAKSLQPTVACGHCWGGGCATCSPEVPEQRPPDGAAALSPSLDR